MSRATPGPMVASFVSDIRGTLRSLRRRPGFALVAIAAIGLGIGANTAVFSAVQALLLGEMPYGDPHRLVAVWEDATFIGFGKNTPAPANYLDWKRMNSVFIDMAATRWATANLTGSGEAEFVLGRRVTPNFFDVLLAKPLFGRTFTAEEDRDDAPVVVISHSLWQRRFGGNPDLSKATLLMNGRTVQVIGVMPAAFAFPDRRQAFWKPFHFDAEEAAKRDTHYLEVVARLKPGVTVRQAQANLSLIAAQLTKEYPATNTHVGAVVVALQEDLAGSTGEALVVIFVAAGFVLLIACLNVANLVLARSLDRRREFAVRAALGAGRGRLISHVLGESLVLAVLGTLAGLAIGRLGIDALQALIPVDMVNAGKLSLDAHALAFCLALTAVSCLLFGLLPAITSSRVDVNDALKQGGRTQISGASLLRSGLVVSQVAFACVLLTGAGLMVQTVTRLQQLDPGFRADHLLTLWSNPIAASDEKKMAFLNEVQNRVRHVPGVVNAGFVSDLPFDTDGDTVSFEIAGRPAPPPGNMQDALNREVTAGYLETLGAQLVAGRFIGDQDRAGASPVVVINEWFAKNYWPGQNALGARIKFHGDRLFQVVGVVKDIRERGLSYSMKPAVYVPAAQVKRSDANELAVRTTGDPSQVASAVREVFREVDASVPVMHVRTIDEMMEHEVRSQRQQMSVLSIFAGLAAFLAALGIYGVLAYSVSQRRREIGLRMALGADRQRVTAMVLRQGGKLAGVGLMVGVAMALAMTRLMENLLFDVKASDPATIALVGLVLGVVAVMACVGPARSAARVDPMKVLHEE